MYIPRHFAVTDPEALHRVIREHSFATLITSGDGEPFATHVPLLLEGTELIGHMARANPHWKLFDGRTALAVFQGPHAYVSPSLYVSSPNVPTWNYVTVHVYGQPQLIEDPKTSADILNRTLAYYDPEFPVDGSVEGYIERLLPGIMAFRIPIDRMEGKFKLNQNKNAEDREAVMERFSNSTHPLELAVAAAMREHYGNAR
jgi:transcriptional regulator